MVILFTLAVLAGVAIGILSGMIGVGGGTIMVPLFRLAFGMSGIGSTATSLFTIIPTSVSGVVSHLRGKTCVPKLGLSLGIGGACLSPVGVMLADASPNWLVMVVAAICIAYSGFTMLRKAIKAPKGTGATAGSAGASEGAGDLGAMRQFVGRDYVFSLFIGAFAGLVSGYVGLGGGFIMVPLMVSLMNMPMKLTSGTSLIAIILIATPATIAQCMLGNVDFLIGIAVACGSIPGAAVGARLVRRVPERTLRFIFAAFLLAASILLVLKETGLFG